MHKLSKEFQVACEIYKYQLKKENIWTNKLINNLSNHMTKSDVVSSLQTLLDWGIVHVDHQETERGLEERVYYIDKLSEPRVKMLYDNWWK